MTENETKLPRWERIGAAEEYEHLCRLRIDQAVPVREPLVLVSQIQRSGGTLLCQLFDGHPEVHAHPPELKISYPDKEHWPPLALEDGPERWFKMLYERAPELHFKRGHRPGPDTFPFLFPPSLQKRIFDRCVAEWEPTGTRDILDAYFTSYFNGWLDNTNLWTGPKRAVTGFTPRLTMEIANAEQFFAAYPDGTLISLVREPLAWYASASARITYRRALERSLGWWTKSASAALEAQRRWGERVIVLTFDQLVADTEATMTRIAERIGIEMSPVLLEPTFNGRPTRANSSRAVESTGILGDRAGSGRSKVDPEIAAEIEAATAGLWAQAQEAAAA